jgi:hypothetical protein
MQITALLTHSEFEGREGGSDSPAGVFNVFSAHKELPIAIIRLLAKDPIVE